MPGVINLRGKAVPVIDLRQQFGMNSAEVTVDSCIIIIEVNISGHSTVLGALADSVQEVIDLSADQMEPAPAMGAGLDNKFIKAMGKTSAGGFIIILNMEKVFSVEQIEEVEQAGSNNDNSDKTAAA